MARWLVLVAIAGCFSQPQPACGFVCGTGGACPAGYTCMAVDNRCHLDGTSSDCPSSIDAGVDGPLTPVVLARMPENGDIDVALDATVRAAFNEAVTNLDPMVGFRLDWSGGFISGSVSLDGTEPFAARYTPIFRFPGSTAITATLTPMVTDAAGNHLALTSWTFTTAPDPVAPVVTSTTPVDGALNVPVDVVFLVAFSKVIFTFTPSSVTVNQGVTGMITSDGPMGVKFTPSAPLAAATTYTVTVATDVTDLSGNHLAAPFSFSFTTM